MIGRGGGAQDGTPAAAAVASSPGTLGTGMRLVDLEIAVAQYHAVERRDGRIGGGGVHFDETKPPGPSGLTVGDQID